MKNGSAVHLLVFPPFVDLLLVFPEVRKSRGRIEGFGVEIRQVVGRSGGSRWANRRRPARAVVGDHEQEWSADAPSGKSVYTGPGEFVEKRTFRVVSVSPSDFPCQISRTEN